MPRGYHLITKLKNKDARDGVQQAEKTMTSMLTQSIITIACIFTSAVCFDSAKVFRVKPQTEKEVDFMKSLAHLIQIDFWYPDSAVRIVNNMEVDFRVSGEQSKIVEGLLKESGIHYEVLCQNLQEDIEKQLDGDKNSQRHSYIKYNEWDKISAWAVRIAKGNPTLVSLVQIGNTFENRPIVLLQIGKKRKEKKAIFMDCGIHAREWISPAFCQWFVKEAIETYGKDSNMTYILDNMNFYIVPVVNIDGYVWSWTQDRFWRKNRSNTSQSDCIGVDLNRNFDVAWNTVDASKNPCEEIYCGTSPESEHETKAITLFIRKHLSSIKAYLTIHAYSQMILFPFGYTYKKTPNYDELNELAKGAANAIASLYGEVYTYGTSASTIYLSSGCSDDWAFSQGINYSFTFELRDKGKYGFLLPESQIESTCQEIMEAVKFMSRYILNKTS